MTHTSLQRRLIEYMHAEAGRDAKWGQNDCTLFLANWWKKEHGVDPAEGIRGTYSTEDDCRALLALNGGLQRLVTKQAKAVRAHRTRTPTLGDIALVEHHGELFGAICVCPKVPGHSWAIRAQSSIALINAPRILQAWTHREEAPHGA